MSSFVKARHAPNIPLLVKDFKRLAAEARPITLLSLGEVVEFHQGQKTWRRVATTSRLS
jgi:hypothetical protein